MQIHKKQKIKKLQILIETRNQILKMIKNQKKVRKSENEMFPMSAGIFISITKVKW